MPDEKFLEEYPLYRKFNYVLPFIKSFPKVSINMKCKKCDNKRTFIVYHIFYMDINQIIDIDKYNVVNESPVEGSHFILEYICASCKSFECVFVLRVGKNLKQIFKTGQYPPWDITISRDLEKIMGEFSEYYEKGNICEFHNHGIGAFAYYRRIVESIIGELLESIPELMSGEELEKYQLALEEVRKTKNTTDKIALVKDLLPSILKTEQFNPLKTIHDALSKGLHGRTDEECLEDAESIKTSLIFLVDAVLSRKKRQQKYTKSMKKLLEKQRKKLIKDKKQQTKKIAEEKGKVKEKQTIREEKPKSNSTVEEIKSNKKE